MFVIIEVSVFVPSVPFLMVLNVDISTSMAGDDDFVVVMLSYNICEYKVLP